MKKSNSKQRGVWSEKENELLGKLVQQKGRKDWGNIAELLNEQCGGRKSGKQCRERFRNYVNPELEKSEWKSNEKLLFAILHQVYGNQWTSISKHLNSRSDIVIKNYFYCLIRKATKSIKSNTIPLSYYRRSEKFYSIYSVLSILKKKYLPVVKNIDKLPRCSPKERLVLSILEKRGVTEEEIEKYQDRMIEELRKRYNPREFPIEITVFLNPFKFSSNKTKDIIRNHDLYNLPPLSNFMRVEIRQEEKASEPLPSAPDSVAAASTKVFQSQTSDFARERNSQFFGLPVSSHLENAPMPYDYRIPFPPFYPVLLPGPSLTQPEVLGRMYFHQNFYWGGAGGQSGAQIVRAHCPTLGGYSRGAPLGEEAESLEPARKSKIVGKGKCWV
eukprot:TRINITY_DN2010_c0_g1_i15.p1 TRINITY_DN2010_c0_g1~~TRINITY_DN2010_c0_g1_i15.p1  ORF type:complete len:387 (+),score=47.26 TRINITY_DN2010_c0_g1_i15:1152-2312(+)